MTNKKSFTIVELLVVMAVIGVLISLTVFGIQALEKGERETRRLNDLRNIQVALESYFSKYNRYPLLNEVAYDSVNTNIVLYNGPALQVVFSRIKVASLIPHIIKNAYATETCTGANAGTANNWFVSYFVSNVGNVEPQKFGLFGCTENGKTKNFGNKD